MIFWQVSFKKVLLLKRTFVHKLLCLVWHIHLPTSNFRSKLSNKNLFYQCLIKSLLLHYLSYYTYLLLFYLCHQWRRKKSVVPLTPDKYAIKLISSKKEPLKFPLILCSKMEYGSTQGQSCQLGAVYALQTSVRSKLKPIAKRYVQYGRWKLACIGLHSTKLQL